MSDAASATASASSPGFAEAPEEAAHEPERDAAEPARLERAASVLSPDAPPSAPPPPPDTSSWGHSISRITIFPPAPSEPPVYRSGEAAEQEAKPDATPAVDHALKNGSGGQPLDSGARSFLEPRFGHDFSQIRIHTDARAEESAESVSARAYTVGSDIVFGRGQYQPGTSAGRELLAHELTHTLQQTGSASMVRQRPDGTETNPATEPGTGGEVKVALMRREADEGTSAGRRRLAHELTPLVPLTGCVPSLSQVQARAAFSPGQRVMRQESQDRNEERRTTPSTIPLADKQDAIPQDAIPEGISFPFWIDLKQFNLDAQQLLQLKPEELQIECIRQLRKKGTKKEAEEIIASEKWSWNGNWRVTKQDIKNGYKKKVTIDDYSIKPSSAEQQQERREYLGGLSSEEQRSLRAEADRQLREKTQYMGRKLGPEEVKYKKALLDELIRQRQAILALPPHVQVLLFAQDAPRVLEPREFATVLRIAEKLTNLSPGEVYALKSSVIRTTTDWIEFETSLDRFLAARAAQKTGQQPPGSGGLTGNSYIDWWLGAIGNEFLDDPTWGQISVNFILSMIPGVDQGIDALDLAAHLYRLGYLGQYDDGWRWVSLAFTLVGLIPEAGSVIKGISKVVIKGFGQALSRIEDIRRLALRVPPGAATGMAWLADVRRLITDRWDEVQQAATEIWERSLARLAALKSDIGDRFARLREISGEKLSNALWQARRMVDEVLEELQQHGVLPKAPEAPSPGKTPGSDAPSSPDSPGGRPKDKQDGDGQQDKGDAERRKATEIRWAEVEASAIAEVNDRLNTPVDLMLLQLDGLKKKYRSIKDFEKRPERGPGPYSIHMIASDHLIDPDYSDAPEATRARETFEPVYNQYLQTGAVPEGPSRAIRPDVNRYPTVEIHPNGDVLGSYNDVLRFAQDVRLTGPRRVPESTIEAHHLIEDNWMERFGVSRGAGRSVALEASDHAYFTAEVPRNLPRNLFFDIDEVFEAHAQVYREAGHPEWVNEIRMFLRQNRDLIRNRYMQRSVPGGNMRDFAQRRERVLRFLDSL